MPLFDGRGWRVGNHDENPRQKLTEYVLPKESVDSWHELVTHQTFVDPGHAVPAPLPHRVLSEGCSQRVLSARRPPRSEQ